VAHAFSVTFFSTLRPISLSGLRSARFSDSRVGPIRRSRWLRSLWPRHAGLAALLLAALFGRRAGSVQTESSLEAGYLIMAGFALRCGGGGGLGRLHLRFWPGVLLLTPLLAVAAHRSTSPGEVRGSQRCAWRLPRLRLAAALLLYAVLVVAFTRLSIASRAPFH